MTPHLVQTMNTTSFLSPYTDHWEMETKEYLQKEIKFLKNSIAVITTEKLIYIVDKDFNYIENISTLITH